jgi:hypothetical protein
MEMLAVGIRGVRQRHAHVWISSCPAQQDRGSACWGGAQESIQSGLPAYPLGSDRSRPRSDVRPRRAERPDSQLSRALRVLQSHHSHVTDTRRSSVWPLVWSPHAELAFEHSECRKGRAVNAVLSYCQLCARLVALPAHHSSDSPCDVLLCRPPMSLVHRPNGSVRCPR